MAPGVVVGDKDMGGKFGVMGGRKEEERKRKKDSEDDDDDDEDSSEDDDDDEDEDDDDDDDDDRTVKEPSSEEDEADLRLGTPVRAVPAPTIVPPPVIIVESFNPKDERTGEWTCIEPIILDGVRTTCGYCFPPGRQQGANITNHMQKKHNKAVAKDPTKKRVRRKAIAAPVRGCGGAASGAAASSFVSLSDSDDDSSVSFLEQLRFEKKRTQALLERVNLLEEAAKANLAVAVSCAKKLLGVYVVCVCVCVYYVCLKCGVCAHRAGWAAGWHPRAHHYRLRSDVDWREWRECRWQA
jgi:hypothetical protein